jgi:cytoskeletal protein CcmA (bactofilin family)
VNKAFLRIVGGNMWGKKIHAPKIDTVIGHQTRFKGDVEFGGGLHLDGMIQGSVIGSSGEANATLTISQSGIVEGDIRVPNVVVNGKVFGDVYASERIELAPNAQINGSVYYNLIEMAVGAIVNGGMVRLDIQGEQTNGKQKAHQSKMTAKKVDIEAGKETEHTKTGASKNGKNSISDMLSELIPQTEKP